MAEIREVGQDGEIVTEPQTILNNKPDGLVGNVTEDMMLRAVEQAMGLETEADRGKYRGKTQELLEYAKLMSEDHSPDSIKWAIRSLEMRLGDPPISEKRINFVARYAFLYKESAKIKKEMREYEQRI